MPKIFDNIDLLTEVEFAHILSTLPLVAEPVKVPTQNAYRNVARGILK